MADVVLKLDADAARYVAEIVKAAERTKDLGKGAKETKDYFTQAGDAIEQAGTKLGKMATIGGLVAVGVAAATKGYFEWVAALERGEKAAKSIVDALRGAAHSASDLKDLGNIRDQIMGMNSPLSMDQRVAAVNSFRQNAPGASSGSAINAVRAASQADIAGMDATQFAGHVGKLTNAGLGNHAGDIAAFLTQRGGAQGGAAIEEMASLGIDAGSGGAVDALGYVSAAAATPGGMGVMSTIHAQWMKQGKPGTFAKFAATAGFNALGIDQMPTQKAIQSRLDAENAAAANVNGYLGQQAGEVMKSPIDLTRITTRAVNARTEADDYRQRGESASNKELEAAMNRNFSTNTTGGVGFSMAPSLMRDLGITPGSDVERAQISIANGGHGGQAKGNSAMGPGFADLAIAIQDQTDEIKRQGSTAQKPAIGTNGEGGH